MLFVLYCTYKMTLIIATIMVIVIIVVGRVCVIISVEIKPLHTYTMAIGSTCNFIFTIAVIDSYIGYLCILCLRIIRI